MLRTGRNIFSGLLDSCDTALCLDDDIAGSGVYRSTILILKVQWRGQVKVIIIINILYCTFKKSKTTYKFKNNNKKVQQGDLIA